VLATENLKAILQDSGLEVRLAKPFRKSSLVLTAGMDGSAKLFDIDSGKVVRILRQSGQPIRYGAVSIDDRLIALAPFGGPVLVWQADSSSPPIELPFGDVPLCRSSRQIQVLACFDWQNCTSPRATFRKVQRGNFPDRNWNLTSWELVKLWVTALAISVVLTAVLGCVWIAAK
jgi:WD40 repeat protein